uniref:hypothetical protein n=1 Tax=Faecalibacterium sp. TaxID=1971605 RepID=UPI00402849C5
RGGVDLDVIKQSFIGAHNKAHSFSSIQGSQAVIHLLSYPVFRVLTTFFAHMGQKALLQQQNEQNSP